VKEKRLDSLTITMDETAVDDTLISDLASVIDSHPGNTKLYIQLHTLDQGNLLLVSRSKTVDVDRKLLQFINDHEHMEYKIN
jgi:DNA polymerase-3 subunit alpha